MGDKMTNIGLVLQGGGMRGTYTAGALDCLLDNELHIPYVVGVSAGACNALSYATHARGLGRHICLNYLAKKNYISYRNLITKGSFIDFDKIFLEIPKLIEEIGIFKHPTHNKLKNMVVAATDCESGKAVYISTHGNKNNDIYKAVRASASMPFISKKVRIKGLELLDGGIADPVPIQKSIDDGNKKNIVILTNPLDYIQQPFKYSYFARKIYPKHKRLVDLIINNHEIYHDCLSYINELENDGKALILKPSKPCELGVLETNKSKLELYYNLGYKDTESRIREINNWLENWFV